MLQTPKSLDAAQAGDDRAFRELVEPHRATLLAHCQRMLGSRHDAEDALQDAMVRAWLGLPRFDRRSSLGTWLYRIATNVCLDAIARRAKRPPPVECVAPAAEGAREPAGAGRLAFEDGRAAPETRYEQREAVELVFVAALRHLPPRQRAVLILREVVGFSAREVSESLDSTVASVNSALQRARKTMEERLRERSEHETVRSLEDESLGELVEHFTDAFERADVDAIRALAAERPDDYTGAAPLTAGGRA